MRSLVLFLIVSLTVCFPAFGQVDTAWVRVYDQGDSYANGVAADSLGNVFVSGWGETPGGGGSITISYDSTGESRWTRFFEEMRSPWFGGVFMATNRSGDIYVLGETAIEGSFCR